LTIKGNEWDCGAVVAMGLPDQQRISVCVLCLMSMEILVEEVF
jgi:hypothetical protein